MVRLQGLPVVEVPGKPGSMLSLYAAGLPQWHLIMAAIKARYYRYHRADC